MDFDRILKGSFCKLFREFVLELLDLRNVGPLFYFRYSFNFGMANSSVGSKAIGTVSSNIEGVFLVVDKFSSELKTGRPHVRHILRIFW